MSAADRIIDHLRFLGRISAWPEFESIASSDKISVKEIPVAALPRYEEMRQRGVIILLNEVYVLDTALRGHISRAVGENSYYVSFVGVDGTFDELATLMGTYREISRLGERSQDELAEITRQFEKSVMEMVINVSSWIVDTRRRIEIEFGEAPDLLTRLSQASFYLKECEKAIKTIHVCITPNIDLGLEGDTSPLARIYTYLVHNACLRWNTDIGAILAQLRDYTYKARRQNVGIKKIRSYLRKRNIGHSFSAPDPIIDLVLPDWRLRAADPVNILFRPDLLDGSETSSDVAFAFLRKRREQTEIIRTERKRRAPSSFKGNDTPEEEEIPEVSNPVIVAWREFLDLAREAPEPISLKEVAKTGPKGLFPYGIMQACISENPSDVALRVCEVPKSPFSNSIVVEDVFACRQEP